MPSHRRHAYSALAASATARRNELAVHLVDGRSVTVPLSWHPRLAHGTAAERDNWRRIGHGEGVHWPDLDADISVDDLLAGRPSGESQTSLRSWLASRAPARAGRRSGRPR